MIVGFLGPIGTAIGWAWDNTVGRAVGAASEGLQNWVIGGVVDAIVWFAQLVDQAIAGATFPDLSAGWFVRHYNVLLAMGLLMALLTFVIQVLAGVVRREPAALGRALSGAMVATMGGFAVLAVSTSLIELVDALSRDILQLAGQDMEGGLERLMTVSATYAAATGGWFVVLMVFGLFAGLAMLLLWLVLTVRMVAIYVVAVFAPIAFAGWGWEKTRGWLTRWSQMLLALIFCKLVMYVIFALSWAMLAGQVDQVDAQMGAPPETEVVVVDTVWGETAQEVELQRSPGAGITLALGGVVMLILAAGAPWATFRFISWAGSAGGDASEMVSPRGAVSGTTLAMTAGGAAMGMKVASVIGSAGAGGAGAAGGGSAAGAAGTAGAGVAGSAPSGPLGGTAGPDSGTAGNSSTQGPGAAPPGPVAETGPGNSSSTPSGGTGTSSGGSTGSLPIPAPSGDDDRESAEPAPVDPVGERPAPAADPATGSEPHNEKGE